MAGVAYALHEGLAGPTLGLNLGAVFLLLAGAAPIAAGIALDRWACRQADAAAATGFEVIAPAGPDPPIAPTIRPVHNPWDPSPDEIRQWAYTPGAEEPCPDWDLALSWSGHEQALLECAADDACPHQARLLGVLYFIVGNAVRSGFRSPPRPVIEGFLARADAYPHPTIRLWQTRSRQLLRDPSTFNHHDWCAGGLANSDNA